MSTTIAYPQVPIDDYLGTPQNFKMKTINGIKAYILSFAEGTLSGGSSPAWTISASNPIITHVAIIADNNPIANYDVAQIQEYIWNYTKQAPDGLNFVIPLSDLDSRFDWQYIADTEFPSYDYTDVTLQLTFAPLSALTSGSPTGSSGSTMNYKEDYVLRAQMSKTLSKPRRFQYNTTLTVTNGINDLTSFLPQVGTFKAIQLFVGTASGYGSPSNTAVSNVNLLLNQTSRPLATIFGLLRNKTIQTFRRTPSTGFATLLFSPVANGLNLSNTDVLKNVDLQLNNTTSANVYVSALATIYE